MKKTYDHNYQKKPEALKVLPENIPEELKAINRWILWRYEQVENKNGEVYWSKIPKTSTGFNAASNKPSTWTTFENVLGVYNNGGYDGLGIVLNGDGLVGVDFDHCVTDGSIDSETQKKIDSLKVYAEISPSGTGIRLFGFGELPPHRRKSGNIEVYDDGRYLTATGHKINGKKVSDFSKELLVFHKEVFGELKCDKVLKKNLPKARMFSFSDKELLEKISKSKQGEKFNALYNGDDLDYPSTSEADLAFMNILAFWTAKDRHQMDRIYLNSPRAREKWNQKRGSLTYGEMTINAAINAVTEIYMPDEGKDYVEFDDDSGAAKSIKIKELCKTILSKANVYLVKEISRDKGIAIYDETTGKFLIDGEDGKAPQRLEKLAKDLLGKYNFLWTSSAKSNFWTWILPEIPEASLRDFDMYRKLLLVGNGVVDLSSKKLLPFDPKYMFSKRTSIKYDENANAPRFQKFLKEITCDRESLLNYMSYLAGYWTTGEVEREEYYIFFGLARAGKSKLFEAIALALEEYATILPEKTVTETGFRSSPDYEMATLRAIRMVRTAEVSDSVNLKVSLVKTATGDSEIPVRPIAGRPTIIINYMKLFVIGNFTIDLGIQDKSIKERTKVIPFDMNIPAEQRDKQLLKKFAAEKEGILKWLVDCAYKYYNGEEPKCTEVIDATAEYFNDVNPLKGFIRCLDFTGPTDEGYSSEELFKFFRKYNLNVFDAPPKIGLKKFQSAIKAAMNDYGIKQSTNPRKDLPRSLRIPCYQRISGSSDKRYGRWYPGVQISDEGREILEQDDEESDDL